MYNLEDLKKQNLAAFIKCHFNDIENKEVRLIKIGTTVIDFLQENYPTGFDIPTTFFLNDKELDSKDLDYKVKEGDVVSAIHKPGEPFFTMLLINIIISVAISYVLSKLMPMPKAKTHGVDSAYESVYSTNVSQIQAKKNGTIPSLYGVTRTYPNLITPVYSRYENNKQIMYLTTCIGTGEYDIIQAYLNENKIEDINNSFVGTINYETVCESDPFGFTICEQDTPYTTEYPDPNEEILTDFGTIASQTTSSNFYNEYFDNSTLNKKNRYVSDTISYGIINGNNLKDITTSARGLTDYNYIHNVKKVEEISNVALTESYQSVGWITVNSITEDLIDKVEIDVIFQGGLYATNDEGNFVSTSMRLRVLIYGYDRYGNTTYQTSNDFDFSSNSKKVIRRTLSVSVPDGRYKIKIIRLQNSSFNETNVANDPTIESVKACFIKRNMDYNNITVAVFKIVSNQDLSELSSLQINLLTRRKNTSLSYGGNYLLSLRDFIQDIWTNKDYGLAEKIDKLEIRENLDENCNIILDSSENGFNLISDTLKGFGYIFYPEASKFVIEKDTYRNISSYYFNESNSSNFSLNYSIPQKDEIGDGVVIKYLKQNELNFSEFRYPIDCDYPEEYVVKGLCTEKQAIRRAFFLYNKQNKRGITASLETEMEGFIPNLNSKISVSRNYLSNSVTTYIDGYNFVFDDLISKTKIKLYQKIEFKKDISYHLLLQYSDGTYIKEQFSIEAFSEDGFYDEFFINGNFEEKNLDIYVTIGEQEELTKEFLVEGIEASQGDENITVKLNLVEYIEEVYDDPTA